MHKSHFAASLWPLRFDGRDMKAVCGKIVKSAQLVMVWDNTEMAAKLENLNSLATCKACIEELANKEVVYLYSCVEGKSNGV